MKNKITIEELCSGAAHVFTDYAKEVMSIRFSAEPDYPKLKHLLVKILLGEN